MDIRQYVKSGAEFLDQEYNGWFDEINLDTLDMSDTYKCILGQLYGDFYEVAFDDDNDYNYDKLAELGFDISCDVPYTHNYFQILDSYWKDEIKSRLNLQNKTIFNLFSN